MTTQQGLRQASFRAIGGTTGTYNEDALAAFAAEATIPDGVTFNGAFILWLQARLSSADDNLPGLMQAFAEQEGAHNWSSLGSFDPNGVEVLGASGASADDARETIATTVVAIGALNLSWNQAGIIGLRLPLDDPIPQGSTISSAILTVMPNGTSETAWTGRIRGEATGTPAQYQEINADISGRALTTATVDVVTPSFVVGVRYALPDIATIVQEIVDADDLEALGLLLTEVSGDTRSIRTFDSGPADAAMITIVYAPA